MKTIGSTLEARHQNGFTLIELLIVTVIIGVLVAIAIPKFSNSKQKAYVAAMKSDLRNLVIAEEVYFGDFTTYTSDQAAMSYNGSAGVTVVVAVTGGSPGGYSATATHTGTAKTCVIYINTAPKPPASKRGQPECII